MLDLFQLLSSPDVNWWTGVVWIIVMFLSVSHSDGTHSLQSIHCWDTDAETHFYKPDEETNSSTSQMILRVSTYSDNVHFWVNYFFNQHEITVLTIGNVLEKMHQLQHQQHKYCSCLVISLHSPTACVVNIWRRENKVISGENDQCFSLE